MIYLKQLFIWSLLAVLVFNCSGQSSNLDRLDQITTTKKLLVAADANTGFPFVHFHKDMEAYGGFEYEVAEYISHKLNAKLEIVPTSWDKLLEALKEDQVDLVLNCIEKPENANQYPEVAFSKPYYVSHQQLMVPKKDNFTYNLSDLDKKKVGSLESSAAAAMLEELNRLKGTKITVTQYKKPELMFEDLAKGKIDALLTERAIGSWFGWQHKDLKRAGDKILEHSYVVALRNQDSRLSKKINEILEKAPQDKVFQAIEKKWHLN